MKSAIPAETPATILSTLCEGPLRPKMEAVASAPSTTSTRMMKMKKRISAVEHPKNAQKIFRAKASRKVSRISDSVAILLFACIGRLRNLRGFHSLHEDVFEGACGARKILNDTLSGAQKIDGGIGPFPRGEGQVQAAVTTGGSPSTCSQLDLQFLRNILRFDPVAASLS